MSLQNVRKYLLRIGLVVLVEAGVLSGAFWPAQAAPTPAATIKHLVTAERARELVTRFRTAIKPGAVQAHAFHRSLFDALLAQPGAARVRIYHARYADGRPTFVLYATDANGQDEAGLSGNTSLPSPPFFRGEEMGAALAASSHLITRDQAETLIARFQSTSAATAVRSHSFDRSLFDALLAEPGTEGIRVYYGKNADGTEALVLYAIDAIGRELDSLVGTSDEAR